MSDSGRGARDAPGRLKIQPGGGRGGESYCEQQQGDQYKGAAVPKWGGWETDPSSGEGLTEVFDNVRKEKQQQAGGGGGEDAAVKKFLESRGYRQDQEKQAMGCSCFPWLKK